jgi:centromere DNA-binding complex CBF3 subunit-like protein
MAGFSHERAGLYHLKRAIPQSLQRHIWPWLDEAAQMYALGYASGQGSDLDQSGDQFVKLLLGLRVVLLQDSALLMPLPKLPLWVFSHDDWSRFAGRSKRLKLERKSQSMCFWRGRSLW